MGTSNPPHQEPGMPVTENMILDALRAVRDPERDGDIVSLGMVTGVVIRDGNVGFAIEVEPERGARLEPLRKAAERAVEALPDVMSVTAVSTAEAKPPGGARSAAPAAAPAQAAPAAGKSAIAPGVRAIVAVASGKGGVGKSTVAANLALGLKANGLRVALIDARKGLNMFTKVNVPVLGIVENMSYFLCPHCGERSDIFSHGGARREAERLGVDFLGEVPLDLAIRETSDEGRPITVSQPDSPYAQTFRDIAAKVWEKVSGESTARRAPPRIVVE